MGQAISIERKFCIQVPEDLLVKYTVKRTSGQMESGWRIPLECYVDRMEVEMPSASVHAKTDSKHWRIFMDNGSTMPETLLFGWRRVNSIYPTDLEGDQDAILEWQTRTQELFDELEKARIAEGGKTPESELKEISARTGQLFAMMAEQDVERMAGYAEEGK